MTVLYALAAIYAPMLAIMAVLLWVAPDGHQSPGGFRYGPAPDEPTS